MNNGPENKDGRQKKGKKPERPKPSVACTFQCSPSLSWVTSITFNQARVVATTATGSFYIPWCEMDSLLVYTNRVKLTLGRAKDFSLWFYFAEGDKEAVKEFQTKIVQLHWCREISLSQRDRVMRRNSRKFRPTLANRCRDQKDGVKRYDAFLAQWMPKPKWMGEKKDASCASGGQ